MFLLHFGRNNEAIGVALTVLVVLIQKETKPNLLELFFVALQLTVEELFHKLFANNGADGGLSPPDFLCRSVHPLLVVAWLRVRLDLIFPLPKHLFFLLLDEQLLSSAL